MSEGLDKQRKKEIMKDIIHKLHKGMSIEEAKETEALMKDLDHLD